MRIDGACLCGACSFSGDGELNSVRYCHCSNCRKFSGTSPATWAMAQSNKLHKSPGTEAQVAKFNSGRGIRCFCKSCGCAMWFESIEYPEVVGIPLGVLDTEILNKPEMHLWVASQPKWCVMQDDLPKFQQGPQ